MNSWRLLVLGSLTIAACGGGASSTSGDAGAGDGGQSSGSSGSSSGATGGSSGGGSGSSSGSTSGSSSGGSGGGAKTGSIFVSQCLSGDCKSVQQLLASAQFSDGSQSSNCAQTMQSGACTGYVCTSLVDAGVPYVSAGTLTLSGGKLASPLTFATSSEGTYAIDDIKLDLDPGETMTVSASGATVPSFSQSLVAPPALVLTKPSPGSGGQYSIATSAELSVAWSGGQAGDSVYLQGYSGGSAYYFECTWDATAGQGTVPKALLTPLAGVGTGALEWLQNATTKFDAGAYSITATTSIGGEQGANFE